MHDLVKVKYRNCLTTIEQNVHDIQSTLHFLHITLCSTQATIRLLAVILFSQQVFDTLLKTDLRLGLDVSPPQSLRSNFTSCLFSFLAYYPCLQTNSVTFICSFFSCVLFCHSFHSIPLFIISLILLLP